MEVAPWSAFVVVHLWLLICETVLSSSTQSLTFERAKELRRQKTEKKEELKKIRATGPKTMWSTDSDAIKEAMDKRKVEIARDQKKEVQARPKIETRTAKGNVAAAKKAKKAVKKKDGVSVTLLADQTSFAYLFSHCSPCLACVP